jgi:AcrR family transcriptional regulator
MGRITTITKERILEAAFDMLVRDGYSNVNIKTLAAEIGCSTQPISWHFGSIQGLRKELYLYARGQVWSDDFFVRQGKSVIDTFFDIGKNYIHIACDQPNLFRFLMIDDLGEVRPSEASILDILFDSQMSKLFCQEYDVPEEKIKNAIRDIIIYTHGLATLMMWDHYHMDKDKAAALIYENGRDKLARIGIEV